MATYNAPSVPVFNAGAAPTETGFDTRLYQTMSFFQNGIVLRASQAGTATTLPSSGSVTTIAYDTIAEDPYSGWSPSTHLWTPPAGYSGWYQATITVRTAVLSSLVDLRPALTGTYTYQLTTVQSAQAGCCATFVVYLVGGQDTLGGACQLLNSGANANTDITAGQNSTLEIVWRAQS